MNKTYLKLPRAQSSFEQSPWADILDHISQRLSYRSGEQVQTVWTSTVEFVHVHDIALEILLDIGMSDTTQ